MDTTSFKRENAKYHSLKLIKKKRLTKRAFQLTFEIPSNLKPNFYFLPGQYSTIRFNGAANDYSYAFSPDGRTLTFGVKMNGRETFSGSLYHQISVGDFVQISEPKGRFTIDSKPNEKRVILSFAAGIGITPILSHLEQILKTERLSRCFLFYGNKSREEIAFYDELKELKNRYPDRFYLFYFFSKQKIGNPLFEGRLDSKRVALIINQFLGEDEEDEESTIWDATDEVLICGPGGMIKSVANACFDNGIRKKNIHFELFQSFDDNIYEIETPIQSIDDIEVKFKYFGETSKHFLENNQTRLLSALLSAGYQLPYSCKSGICGTCQCRLMEGKVEMIEDEYLTENEKARGIILPCVSIAMSHEIALNFDPE